MERIVIKFVERPDFENPEKMLKWFCDVFGLSSGDDAFDSIEEQILKNFTEAAQKNEGLSSSELKLNTDLARSSVIYHLNRFIEVGLLVKHGRKYYLRASEMQKAIEEIQYDMEREMQRMLDTAKEFDRRIGESGFNWEGVTQPVPKRGKSKGKVINSKSALNPLQWNNAAMVTEYWINNMNPVNVPVQIQQKEKAKDTKKDVKHGKRKGTGKQE